MRQSTDTDLVARFQRSLLLLAAVIVAGTAVELAMQRHWGDAVELIPWLTLGAVTTGIITLALTNSRAAVLTGRAIGATAAAAGLYGIYVHITENHHAGPLDFEYTDRWPTMSAPSQWWAAATGGVGPSPALAPAMLTLAAACLLLATLGQTARRHAARSETSRPGAPDGATPGRPADVTHAGQRANADSRP